MTQIVLYLIVGYGLMRVSWRIAHRKKRLPPKPVWRVSVQPATKRSYDYDHPDGELVDGEISVRLVREKESMTHSAHKLKNVNFERNLNKAVHDAEERAAALNAAYEETNS